MGDVIKFVFDPFGLGDAPTQPQGPSDEELAAQKRLDEAEDKRTALETAKGVSRTRTSTARAAGAQTLFTRPGSIPKPTRLGGGQR